MHISYKLKTALFYSGLIAAITFAAPASAQVQNQTETADPGRASEALREQLQIPTYSPNISITPMDVVEAPDNAEDIVFRLDQLNISGNTAYSDEVLYGAYDEYMGQDITLGDLYRIANSITLKYRNDGYVLTQVIVPPQTIDGGTAQIQVVEGYVDTVTIDAENEDEQTLQIIRDYANGIPNDRAINIKDLERQLLLINDLPGVEARSILSPSASAAGGADMLIIIDRVAMDGLLTFDNYSSRFLGQYSLGGVATMNSALGMNEAITAQFSFAPGSGYELLYGALGYQQPIGPYGTSIGGIVSKTLTEPGFTLSQFDVRGQSELFSVNLRHPLIRSRNTNLEARVLFDWREVTSSNNIPDFREDNLRVVRGGLNYDFLDRLIGVAVNEADFEIAHGLDLFGASQEGDANLTRPDADPQFVKANLEIQRLQNITGPFNLLVAAQGQWSDGALLSSEEFGVGGYYSGRGYDPSEIIGDQGVSGQIEVQWNNPIKPDTYLVEKTQVFGFYDVGKVWNDDATTLADRQNSLASAGIGVRLNFVDGFDAGASVAFPLSREVESESNQDPRFYFNLNKSF